MNGWLLNLYFVGTVKKICDFLFKFKLLISSTNFLFDKLEILKMSEINLYSNFINLYIAN